MGGQGFWSATGSVSDDTANEVAINGTPSQFVSNPLLRSEYVLAGQLPEEVFQYPIAQPMVWRGGCEQQAFTKQSKYTHVRNGQPTPPPYDENAQQQPPELYPLSQYQYDGTHFVSNPTPRGSFSQQVQPVSSADPPPKRRKAQKSSPETGTSQTEDDKEKRAKFLERNRLAASKCREKKKIHTEALGRRYEELARMREDLMQAVADLRRDLLGLKNEVLRHADCNNAAIDAHLRNMVTNIQNQDNAAAELAANANTINPERPASRVTDRTQGLSFGFDSPFPIPPSRVDVSSSEESLMDEGTFPFSNAAGNDDAFSDLINC
ncbi:hypothetical protein BO71DRAFT_392545 [Aspergillus ellipticus CBS 707.79]|uniref:BZIP domain-containing protein n=1 Tax=Aspergillus ellipticus CBS 707.79 TaxID=1448320 RepID=A0A319CRP5_9EURO|nr:hypothetical protein BO71DRAFT_392545 [Aspergillus ellipticus CBS 707.79]